jgi:hypothetical protein
VRGALIAALAAVTLGAGWSPPIPVAPTVRTGELTTSRDFPAPVALDAGWLVFWEDARHSPYVGPQMDTMVAAYGSRVSATNTVIDPAGLRVSPSSLSQSDPTAACFGSQCLVAWQLASLGVVARTFDAATGTFGPEHILTTVAPSSGEFVSPQVVLLGGEYHVSWGTFGGLRARRVQTDGTPEGLTETVQDNAVTKHDFVKTASDGTRAMLVWIDDVANVLSGEIVNSFGAVAVGPFQIATVVFSGPPAVAVVPTGFLVGWIDMQARPAFRRFGLDGMAIDAAPVYPLGTQQCVDLALTSDGTNYVFGCCNGALYTMVLSAATLALLTPNQPTFLSASPTRLRLGQPLNGKLLATWSEPVSFGPQAVFSGLVDLSASPLVPTSIATVTQQLPDEQLAPRVARLGNGFAVAYLSFVDGQRTPWLATFDSVGNSLGAPALLDPATDLHGLDVDYDPVTGLTRVAWAGELGVFAVTLNAAGQPGPATTLSANPARLPRLTSLGGRAFVAWVETTTSSELHGRFIELDGGASAAVSPLYTTTEVVVGLDVTASSTSFAVAWGDAFGASFARVSATGAALGAVPLAVNGFTDSLALASDGTGFLAVWNADGLMPAQSVRFNAAGQLIDLVAIDISSPEVDTPGYDITSPDVAWDGQRYVIAYTERVADGGGLEVYVRSVDTDAGTVGPVERLGVGPGTQHSPALAAAPGGTVALVWLDGQESAVGVNRAFLSIRSDAGSLDAGADGGSDAGSGGGAGGGAGGGGGEPTADAGRGRWTLAAGCGCQTSGAACLSLLTLLMWPRRPREPRRRVRSGA